LKPSEQTVERETDERENRELANLKTEVNRLRNSLSLLGDLGTRIMSRAA
jgi:hypothetical protein